MSAHAQLLLVLVLVYLSDCYVWLRRSAWAFVSRTNVFWSARRPRPLFSSGNGGLVLLNPLPPFGSVLAAHAVPAAVSPAGVTTYTGFVDDDLSETPAPVVTRSFDTPLAALAQGNTVVVDGSPLVICSSARQANRFARLLRDASSTEPDRRPDLIRAYWARSFAGDAAYLAIHAAGLRLGTLKLLCGVMFAHVFVLAPLAVWLTGLAAALLPAAAAMFGIAVLAGVEYHGIHALAYPELKQERIANTVKMILCPPAAIRAQDLIMQHACEDNHPLAVAKALLTPARCRQVGRHYRARLAHPIVLDGVGRAELDILRWHNALLLSFVEATLGAAPAGEPSPDATTSGIGALGFSCPRCGSRYSQPRVECPDCPGVRLADGAIEEGGPHA